jgi:hypothetical protein
MLENKAIDSPVQVKALHKLWLPNEVARDGCQRRAARGVPSDVINLGGGEQDRRAMIQSLSR